MNRTFEFKLFADYFQFYLADENSNSDLSQGWTKEAVDRLLAIAPGTIGVGTARNMVVPVVVEVTDDEPLNEDTSAWDQVNECTIEVRSERIVIAGCTDYVPDAAGIDLRPGTYRARIYYGKLRSLSANELEGEDHYRIVLWNAAPGPLMVIKQRILVDSEVL